MHDDIKSKFFSPTWHFPRKARFKECA